MADQIGHPSAPFTAPPLVGRERELALLVDALGRARAAREPQLVTLIGVPGIGKSRLVYELFRHVEAGGELVYEVAAQNPFVVFGGLGGSGTPL